MKKRFAGLSFILLTTVLISTGMIHSQTNSPRISENLLELEVNKVYKPYSMRLDFMTESMIDDILESGTVGLEQLCAYTMGCQSRKDVVLNNEDRIQLFIDARVKSVELIKLDSDQETSIAFSITNSKESFITVPQQITRDNIELFRLRIRK